MSRIGRYSLYEVAVLARVAGRYEPYWPLHVAWRGCFGPLSLAVTALAVICCVAWLFWPVSLAVMSRIGRYLLYEVAAMARIVGRYGLYWALPAVWRGCVGPYRWPL